MAGHPNDCLSTSSSFPSERDRERLKEHYLQAYDWMTKDGDGDGASRAACAYCVLLGVGQEGGSPTTDGALAAAVPVKVQREYLQAAKMCERTGNEFMGRAARAAFYGSLGLLVPGEGQRDCDGTVKMDDGNVVVPREAPSTGPGAVQAGENADGIGAAVPDQPGTPDGESCRRGMEGPDGRASPPPGSPQPDGAEDISGSYLNMGVAEYFTSKTKKEWSTKLHVGTVVEEWKDPTGAAVWSIRYADGHDGIMNAAEIEAAIALYKSVTPGDGSRSEGMDGGAPPPARSDRLDGAAGTRVARNILTKTKRGWLAKPYVGTVVEEWMDVGGGAMYSIRYDDGDDEDMNAAEILAAVALYKEITPAGGGSRSRGSGGTGGPDGGAASPPAQSSGAVRPRPADGQRKKPNHGADAAPPNSVKKDSGAPSPPASSASPEPEPEDANGGLSPNVGAGRRVEKRQFFGTLPSEEEVHQKRQKTASATEAVADRARPPTEPLDRKIPVVQTPKTRDLPILSRDGAASLSALQSLNGQVSKNPREDRSRNENVDNDRPTKRLCWKRGDDCHPDESTCASSTAPKFPRRSTEDLSIGDKNTPIILEIEPEDVVVGSDGAMLTNVAFNEKIEDCVANNPKAVPIDIRWIVYRDVRRSGGRFLKAKEEGKFWVQASKQEAMNKIEGDIKTRQQKVRNDIQSCVAHQRRANKAAAPKGPVSTSPRSGAATPTCLFDHENPSRCVFYGKGIPETAAVLKRCANHKYDKLIEQGVAFLSTTDQPHLYQAVDRIVARTKVKKLVFQRWNCTVKRWETPSDSKIREKVSSALKYRMAKANAIKRTDEREDGEVSDEDECAASESDDDECLLSFAFRHTLI